MSLKHLTVNSAGTFRYRRVVPPELHNAAGAKVLTRNLKTTDPAEAARRWPQAHAWAEGVLLKARRTAASATDGDIDHAARQYLRRELNQIEATAPALDPEGTALPIDFGNPAWRSARIEEAIQQTGMAVREGTDRWETLRRAMEDALDDSIIADAVRRGGLPLPPDIVEKAGQGPSVSVAITKWIGRREARIGLKGASEARRAATLFGKQKLISEIKKADAVKFRDELIEDGKSVATVKKYVMYLKGAFDDFSEPLDPAPRNPFAGLKYIEIGKPREARRAFSFESLEALFKLKHFTNPKNDANGQASFWVTLLALFTGARQSEIIQLNKADITTAKKIAVIDFHGGRGDESKNIKNTDSIRRVPVPEALIEIGFMKYVEGQKGRLFKIKSDSHENPAGLFSKRINRVIRKVERDAAVDFHSLRHTFIQWATEAELRPDYIKAIVGHEDESTTNRSYGMRLGTSPAALKRGMDKIVFPVDVKQLAFTARSYLLSDDAKKPERPGAR
ncbi:MAG: site-specific integrase [Ferrovibrio sp.]|uniref:site-specific integrase n=1 Tax=Ferrovibrio sp. TaxID=1917215 RepID=UPI0026040BF3|nr:site-specific integrase [Ferrovibrio sp.]MCW0232904.1 site-specific integrase [Ferrovibrio sp.]